MNNTTEQIGQMDTIIYEEAKAAQQSLYQDNYENKQKTAVNAKCNGDSISHCGDIAVDDDDDDDDIETYKRRYKDLVMALAKRNYLKTREFVTFIHDFIDSGRYTAHECVGIAYEALHSDDVFIVCLLIEKFPNLKEAIDINHYMHEACERLSFKVVNALSLEYGFELRRNDYTHVFTRAFRRAEAFSIADMLLIRHFRIDRDIFKELFLEACEQKRHRHVALLLSSGAIRPRAIDNYFDLFVDACENNHELAKVLYDNMDDDVHGARINKLLQDACADGRCKTALFLVDNHFFECDVLHPALRNAIAGASGVSEQCEMFKLNIGVRINNNKQE